MANAKANSNNGIFYYFINTPQQQQPHTQYIAECADESKFMQKCTIEQVWKMVFGQNVCACVFAVWCNDLLAIVDAVRQQ